MKLGLVMVLVMVLMQVQVQVLVLFFGSLINSVARNPSLKGELFRFAILGFALTEAVGLLALMMSFLILFM